MNYKTQPKYSVFDELRTVQRTNIFQLKSIYGVSALRDITTGTVNQSNGEYTLENGGAGDVTVLDTAQRVPYAAGFVTEAGMGVRLPSKPTGDTKVQFGPFGDNDGWFYEFDANGLNAVVRRSGTDTSTRISAWSANDTLFADTLRVKEFDPTDGFIYQIAFSWYAFGPAQFEYQIRDLDAINPNWFQLMAETRPTGETSVTDPQQPIRVRVETGVGDPAYTAYVGGRQCSIIGDYKERPRETTVEVTVSGVDDTAWYPAFAIKRNSVTPYALTQLGELGIRATGDIRVLIENNGNVPSGSYVVPDDYTAAETLLRVNTTPGSTQGNGITLQKLKFVSGSPSDPGGRTQAVERTPLIEDQPQIVYVRRYSGAAIDVDVIGTFLEDF